MTREQAEKLKAEKRRKRLRKKRIKAFATLGVIIIVAAAVVVFAVKAINSRNAESEYNPQDSSSDSMAVESTEIFDSESTDTAVSSEISDVSSADENSSESTYVSSSAGTAAQKPEQTWSTMLVNQSSHMPEGYVPEVRRVYNCGADTGKDFDTRAADALELMLSDARAAGYNMYLVSAYRTYDYQVGLFNRKVNEYKAAGYDDATAYSEASQWVAIPGTSEHCIGLAADIVSSTWYNYNSDLTHDFENTEHFTWLYENCADYGFILRYPKGKESVTQITYEPWHYRYVGVEAAKYIMENNLTLEEFCAE